MSALSEALNALGLHNNWELILKFGSGKDVAVDYSPGDGRASYNKTSVFSPRFKTDPKSHFMDAGAKTFSGNRAKSLPRALEWATAEYGISE